MLLFSQGTPMILAGDEFGNSQEGNNNPYCHDDAVTWLNWKPTKTGEQIRNYVKQLIAFRTEHPVLHQAKALCMAGYVILWSARHIGAWSANVASGLFQLQPHIGCAVSRRLCAETGWNFR